MKDYVGSVKVSCVSEKKIYVVRKCCSFKLNFCSLNNYDLKENVRGRIDITFAPHVRGIHTRKQH